MFVATAKALFDVRDFITDGKRIYMVTTVAKDEATGFLAYYLASYFVRGGSTKTIRIPADDVNLYRPAVESSTSY